MARTSPFTDLTALVSRFHSEDKCREYLEQLRWPEGVRCPRCDARKGISRIETRGQFECNSCGYQFSVRVGTVLHDSHLPLWKWFLAVYVMGHSQEGVSANQLRRMLGLSYKTAWYLCHRIRSAMEEASPDLLTGTVEADETYIGGKLRTGTQRADMLKNKTMVIGAIERGGDIRLRVSRQHRATSREVQGFLAEVAADDTTAIYTDQATWYKGIADQNTRHESVDHSAEEWVRGDVSTQSIESAWSLLKRSIVGSYHQLSAKHLQAYMDEFTFRFNNRENPFLFRDTLLKLISAGALTYSRLIAAETH